MLEEPAGLPPLAPAHEPALPGEGVAVPLPRHLQAGPLPAAGQDGQAVLGPHREGAAEGEAAEEGQVLGDVQEGGGGDGGWRSPLGQLQQEAAVQVQGGQGPGRGELTAFTKTRLKTNNSELRELFIHDRIGCIIFHNRKCARGNIAFSSSLYAYQACRTLLSLPREEGEAEPGDVYGALLQREVHQAAAPQPQALDDRHRQLLAGRQAVALWLAARGQLHEATYGEAPCVGAQVAGEAAEVVRPDGLAAPQPAGPHRTLQARVLGEGGGGGQDVTPAAVQEDVHQDFSWKVGQLSAGLHNDNIWKTLANIGDSLYLSNSKALYIQALVEDEGGRCVYARKLNIEVYTERSHHGVAVSLGKVEDVLDPEFLETGHV